MLRNKEFRTFLTAFGLMSVFAISIGYGINEAACILVSLTIIAFGITFYLFTKARYKSIEQIADQIDLVLHNTDNIYIGEEQEGELSILHSEITKMTLRIREQNNALRKEKEHLSTSLADISHQLRTPLTSLNLIMSLLTNNPEEVERKELIREAEELLIQMDWLITSLLTLSRLDAGIVIFKKEKIQVSHLIQTSLRPLVISMELHEICVVTDIPNGMTIQGDMGWLCEAIQNILKNCMESIGNNATIDIACLDNPLYNEITIKDSGTGFEQEDLPFLFERFYRGKNQNASGYGIGLALSKMIITRQGGIIMAKNHPEGGALFTIRFPK